MVGEGYADWRKTQTIVPHASPDMDVETAVNSAGTP